MRTLVQDVRYALRLFANYPGMTAVAVLSLGLATGPNAAIFSIVNTLFFQGLAVEKPGELVAISAAKHNRGEGVTYPDYMDLAGGSRAFSSVVAWQRRIVPVAVRGWEQVCPGNAVSPNYFEGLGVKPALGRLFAPELDGQPSADAPAVISYSLWQRRFGGSPDVLNQTVQMGNRNLVIVGVAPQRFSGMDFHLPADVWLPLSAMSRPGEMTDRERGGFETVLGRLRSGATLAQARAEVDAFGKRLAEFYPATNKGRVFTAEAFAKKRLAIGLILGGIALGLVSLVLLVACANVAGLLLAQAEARRREIAVRLSLGAGRWRLVRQLLTESVVLGLMGGGAGLLFGYWLLNLPIQPPIGISLDYGIRLDWRMFAYAILISAATALLFGLAPALRASKRDLVTELKADHGEMKRGRRFLSMRNVLVVGQIAASQFLLAGTVLWVRSYMNVNSVRPGFDQARNVIFAHLAPTAAANAGLPGPEAYQVLMERLRGLPGVVEVSSTNAIPLSGSGVVSQKALLPGDSEETPVRNSFIAPRYFAVMGTRLLRGRDFDARDGAVGKSIIVNETLAKRMAPDGDAVGRFLRVEGVEREVVGVAEDGKFKSLRDDPAPFMYLPSNTTGILAVATAASPTAVSEALRRTVTQTVPQLRVLSFVTLKQNMRFATYLDAIAASLLGSLGLLGIFLAAVGLYGVVSAAVVRRRREIGIRVAIGADPRKVVRMVLGDGLRLALTGVAIGLAAAVAGAVAISSLLFGVNPADPLSYICGAVVVVAIAIAASHVPARRASRVDPAVALRSE